MIVMRTAEELGGWSQRPTIAFELDDGPALNNAGVPTGYCRRKSGKRGLLVPKLIEALWTVITDQFGLVPAAQKDIVVHNFYDWCEKSVPEIEAFVIAQRLLEVA